MCAMHVIVNMSALHSRYVCEEFAVSIVYVSQIFTVMLNDSHATFFVKIKEPHMIH